VEDSLYRLSNLWINIEEVFSPCNKGGKQRVFRHHGRLFAIMETWTQNTIAPSSMPGETEVAQPERIIVAWKIKAGDWLLEYLAAPRYVALLCDQALKYDPYHEIWEKRLSRYLLFFLRINAKHQSSVLTRSVEELLQANALPINKGDPHKTRGRFEKALNRLLADHQLDHWEYVPASIAALPARKWLEVWQQWSVRLSVRSRLVAPAEED
jgi:hypothetical protein